MAKFKVGDYVKGRIEPKTQGTVTAVGRASPPWAFCGSSICDGQCVDNAIDLKEHNHGDKPFFNPCFFDLVAPAPQSRHDYTPQVPDLKIKTRTAWSVCRSVVHQYDNRRSVTFHESLQIWLCPDCTTRAKKGTDVCPKV